MEKAKNYEEVILFTSSPELEHVSYCKIQTPQPVFAYFPNNVMWIKHV